MASRKKQPNSTATRYSPHPGLGMEAKAMQRLHAETGKTFARWTAIARRAQLGKAADLQAWLRDEHGLGSRVAGWIAAVALAPEQLDHGDPEILVDALYSGPRARWRALHERLVDELLALGDDVIVTACKTMVPAYRRFVFADLRPVAGGVALHLALGQAKTGRRLRESAVRAGDDRLTRVVVVEDADQIDDQLRSWLVEAYVAGAKRATRSLAYEVPREFSAALRRSAAATATWKTCTPAMQRDLVTWITGAKQEATRAKRLATAIGKLAAGERRVY